MNGKNEKYLIKHFPGLYKQAYLDPSETCMCWGFECGNGWFEIIKNLSEEITKVDPTVEAIQVKEKFGGLRFYINHGTKEIYDLINEAEDKSFKTCEKCGSKENVKTGAGKFYWILTLCKKCQLDRENNPNVWNIKD